MSVVEGEGFRCLLKYLQSRYTLQSSKYFSETGIQFIINSKTVWEQYRVSTDTQSPGIGVGTVKVRSMHPLCITTTCAPLCAHEDMAP